MLKVFFARTVEHRTWHPKALQVEGISQQISTSRTFVCGNFHHFVHYAPTLELICETWDSKNVFLSVFVTRMQTCVPFNIHDIC